MTRPRDGLPGGQALPETIILACLLGMVILIAAWAFHGAWEEASSFLLTGITLPIP